MSEQKPKKVKHPEVTIGDESFVRIPIKTHVIMKDDMLMAGVVKYAE